MLRERLDSAESAKTAAPASAGIAMIAAPTRTPANGAAAPSTMLAIGRAPRNAMLQSVVIRRGVRREVAEAHHEEAGECDRQRRGEGEHEHAAAGGRQPSSRA
jgi:hypothetical protein